MKKFTTLLLVISFIGMNCATHERGVGLNLELGQERGSDLVVQNKDGRKVEGELIAVKRSAILLRLSYSSLETSVDIDDIKIITIMKGTKAGIGSFYGFVIGGSIGVLLASTSKGWGSGTPRLIGLSGAFWDFLGCYMGWGVGDGIERKETIQIEGISEAEIKKVLDDLRKKARIPNFQ